MKRNILLLSALCSCYSLFAEEVPVNQLKYAGPYSVQKPFLIDSLDVNSRKYAEKELLKTAIPFQNVQESSHTIEVGPLPQQPTGYSLHLASFYLNSDRYTDGTLSVEGPESIEVYIDGQKKTLANSSLKLTLEPHRYEVVIKYLSTSEKTEKALTATFKTDSKAIVTATTDPEKRYTIREVFDGTRFRSVGLSPNGKYLLTDYRTTFPGGETEAFQQVTDLATGQV